MLTTRAGQKPKKRRIPKEIQPLDRTDCKRFLELLALGHPVAVCALMANISVPRLYELRDKNEAFLKAWEVAYLAGSDFLEDEARRRGVEGVEKPLYHNGQRVMEGGEKVSLREYSDSCLFFTLKCRNRAKYEGQPQVRITTPEGDPTAAPGEIPRDVPLIGIYLQSPTTFERPPPPQLVYDTARRPPK